MKHIADKPYPTLLSSGVGWGETEGYSNMTKPIRGWCALRVTEMPLGNNSAP